VSVWTDRPRYVSRQVLWGATPTDITRYVTGDIVIRREARNYAITCEIPVTTELLAYFAVGTLSAPADLEVWATCTSVNGTDTVQLFRGRCEAPKNTGLLRMRGSITGVFNALTDTPGCLLVSAMQGYSRVDLLASFATAAGSVYGTLDATRLVSSREPLKPIDLQGISTADLINRWHGGIDGWEARVNASGVELVPLDEIAGPTVTPLYELDASTYYSTAENAPSRPATQYVLSGQTLTVKEGDVETEEEDETGTTTTTTTWTDGVVTKIVRERTETYAPHGITVSPAVEQVVSRTTIDITYNQADGHNTAQMETRLTVTEKFYSPFAYGGTYYRWKDGTYHTEEYETLREVGRLTETFTWDLTKCYISKYTATKQGWMAPLSEISDDGNFADPQVLWGDEGKYRVVEAEEYIQTEELVVKEYYSPTGGGAANLLYFWGDARAFGDSHPYRFRAKVEILSRWGSKNGSSWIYPRVSMQRVTTWKETKDGQRHEKRTIEYRMSRHKYYAASPEVMYCEPDYGSPTDDKRQIVMTPLPHPETKSPTQRAFYLTPFVQTHDTASAFDAAVKSYFSELFEDAGEALRTARWDARRQLADEIVVSHPGDPNMLEWDPVTISDEPRAITEKPGWIHSIEWRLGSAGLRQTTTVKIDPDALTDPMETT